VLFSARNSAPLQARLVPEDRPDFKLQWSAADPADDWTPYLATYMKEIGRRYFAAAAGPAVKGRDGARGASGGGDAMPVDSMAARTTGPTTATKRR